MRVCIDISCAIANSHGISRYTRELVLALSKLPENLSLTLFHINEHGEVPAALQQFHTINVPASHRLWRAMLLPSFTPPLMWGKKYSDFDLFHGPDYVAPHLSKPTVITIHDLTGFIFPQFHGKIAHFYHRISLPYMARRAAALLTDAESTKAEIVNHFGVSPDRIHAIHLGVDHNRFFVRDVGKAQERVLQELGIHAPYILAVGTLEPRKNLVSLIKAYAQLGKNVPKLVISGTRGWLESDIFKVVEELKLQDSVHFTGFVPDALLPELYSGADLFVYPSYYEGFGLPVLEAMASGVPTITSNVSSLPEVAGNAALLIDPHNVDDLANAMRLLLESLTFREELRTKGLSQAKKFTWERTAKATLDVYNLVTHRT